MAEPQVTISPGTESILRANFAKGFYYHDDESLLKCADTLSQFAKDKDIVKKIDDFRSNTIEIEQINQKLKHSRDGEIYLTIQQKNELSDRLVLLKTKVGALKKDLINFIIGQMERKELMKKTYTILTLKKLPLTLRGTRAAGPEEEIEDEEYYGEEE